MGNASASQINVVFEAQWLAYALPYRRFTPAFTDDGARLGADVVRYSFIAVDLHHLLLAGLPAHTQTSRESWARTVIQAIVDPAAPPWPQDVLEAISGTLLRPAALQSA